MINLPIKEIKDPLLRKAFEQVKSYLDSQKLLGGSWRFLEIVVPGALTNLKVPHSLGFTPKDVLTTSVLGTGAVTWSYSLFDAECVYLTTTGACTVRAFIGSYSEG